MSIEKAGAFVEDRSVLSRTARKADEQLRYGDFAEQVADVWRGSDGKEKRPLVIFIHGGYWRPPIDRSHAATLSAAVADAGFTVASIEYRRIPGQPEITLGDVAHAVAGIPAQVQGHNGKSIVMGHSAGGHLALWAGAKRVSPAIDGVLALGPAADLEYGFAHGVGDHAVRAFLGSAPAEKADVDPTKMPHPNCRVTLVHGEQDAVAPIAMSLNYVSAHPQSRLKRIDQCGHFALIDPLSAAWSVVMAELRELA
jgi:acetyl esterase/lipase